MWIHTVSPYNCDGNIVIYVPVFVCYTYQKNMKTCRLGTFDVLGDSNIVETKIDGKSW